jgi:hypothetical protein
LIEIAPPRQLNRSMAYMRRLASILIFLLMTMLLSFPSYSQTQVDTFEVSIAIDKPTIVLRQKILLHVTINNNTSGPIRTDSLNVALHLSKFETDETKCRFGDCYIATTYWEKFFGIGERQQIDVDLSDLYWKDLISNYTDTSRPKNFSRTVPPGRYYLFMNFPLPNQAGMAAREAISNVLVVTVKRAHTVLK